MSFDITEQKWAGEALRASEAKYREEAYRIATEIAIERGLIDRPR